MGEARDLVEGTIDLGPWPDGAHATRFDELESIVASIVVAVRGLADLMDERLDPTPEAPAPVGAETMFRDLQANLSAAQRMARTLRDQVRDEVDPRDARWSTAR